MAKTAESARKRRSSGPRSKKSGGRPGKSSAKPAQALARATVKAVKKSPRRPTKPEKAHTQTRAQPQRQKFVASHLRTTSFDQGLRSYAQYRDLGIKDATGGLVQAHVIRFVPPCRPEEVSKLHFHDVDFQMIYVLKGWIKSEFAGEGAHRFEAGSCWIQPPRIEHRVLDYSDDCEVLEIIMPADFDTVTLD